MFGRLLVRPTDTYYHHYWNLGCSQDGKEQPAIVFQVTLRARGDASTANVYNLLFNDIIRTNYLIPI